MSGSVRPYVTYYSSQFNVPYKATYVPIIYSVVIQLNSNKTKPFESYFSLSARAVRLPTHIEHPPQMDMWMAIHYKFNPHQIYVTHTFSPTALYYIMQLHFYSLSLQQQYYNRECSVVVLYLARLRVVRVYLYICVAIYTF